MNVASTDCVDVKFIKIFEGCLCGHSEDVHNNGHCFACDSKRFEDVFVLAMSGRLW